MEKIDYTLKIALLGDPMTGKSSLQHRYLGLGFKSNYTPTLGVNFSSKDMRSEKGYIRILIVDMAGQKNFAAIREKFFLGVAGCLLVFDVTRPYNADQQILPWVDEVLQYTSTQGLPLAVLANKIDLTFLRQIPVYSGMNAAVEVNEKIESRFPVDYFETSAKDGQGVDEAFEWLIEQVIRRVD